MHHTRACMCLRRAAQVNRTGCARACATARHTHSATHSTTHSPYVLHVSQCNTTQTSTATTCVCVRSHSVLLHVAGQLGFCGLGISSAFIRTTLRRTWDVAYRVLFSVSSFQVVVKMLLARLDDPGLLSAPKTPFELCGLTGRETRYMESSDSKVALWWSVGSSCFSSSTPHILL